jgi:peroxiredoxin
VRLFLLTFFLTTLFNHRPAPLVRATVFVFLSTECPISQQYARRLAELHHEFSDKGITFVAVFPLRTDDFKSIGRFKTECGLPFSAKSDPQQKLALQLRAHVTPEAVVQTQTRQIIYQGAIDDWFFALGKHRPEPSQQYLRDAIRAFLANQPVLIQKTEAVGCFIE